MSRHSGGTFNYSIPLRRIVWGYLLQAKSIGKTLTWQLSGLTIYAKLNAANCLSHKLDNHSGGYAVDKLR
jgi:hypothetical protein